MEKVTNFRRDTVEVCRNCHAEGVVHKAEEGKHYGSEVCPVCGGSGLVRKLIEGRVTVEPHRRLYGER